MLPNIAGIETMSVEALGSYYGTDEATEGRNVYLERREPDFSKVRKKW